MARLKIVLFFIIAKICTSQAGINLFKKNSCKHFVGYPIAPVNPDCYNNPNVKSNLVTMIKRTGYPVEVHPMTTEDGFILLLHRIPNPGGQPIILQHGVVTNGHVWADHWNDSLAYAAHDEGYDVWITGLRGTTYGKENLYLSQSDNEYWNFNLDILAKRDVNAILAHIHNFYGGVKKIVYIGHSMGTTISYMYAAENPDKVNKYLEMIVSLSPVGYIDKSPGVKVLSPFGDTIRAVLNLLGIRGIFRHDTSIQAFTNGLCRATPFTCYTIIQLLFGKDPKQFRSDDLLLHYASWLVSVSVDVLVQYLQIAKTERFQHFDHGKNTNLELYGQEIPPAYNLSNIELPVLLFYGNNDIVCPYQNVLRLYTELGSKHKQMIHISEDMKTPFSHVNFEYAKDARTLLFPILFKTIAEVLKQNPSSDQKKPDLAEMKEKPWPQLKKEIEQDKELQEKIEEEKRKTQKAEGVLEQQPGLKEEIADLPDDSEAKVLQKEDENLENEIEKDEKKVSSAEEELKKQPKIQQALSQKPPADIPPKLEEELKGFPSELKEKIEQQEPPAGPPKPITEQAQVKENEKLAQAAPKPPNPDDQAQIKGEMEEREEQAVEKVKREATSLLSAAKEKLDPSDSRVIFDEHTI